ncbi:MAG: hypothetical protein H0U02_02075 [Rubrobacter sp.]|nr:hypothetical protein [Rubrobacter sp.]
MPHTTLSPSTSGLSVSRYSRNGARLVRVHELLALLRLVVGNSFGSSFERCSANTTLPGSSLTVILMKHATVAIRRLLPWLGESTLHANPEPDTTRTGRFSRW